MEFERGRQPATNTTVPSLRNLVILSIEIEEPGAFVRFVAGISIDVDAQCHSSIVRAAAVLR